MRPKAPSECVNHWVLLLSNQNVMFACVLVFFLMYNRWTHPVFCCVCWERGHYLHGDRCGGQHQGPGLQRYEMFPLVDTVLFHICVSVCCFNYSCLSVVSSCPVCSPVFPPLVFLPIGNTVLHILVLQPNKMIACQAIDLIMAHDAELDQPVSLDMVPNYRGLTPFKLAAKEGNVVVSGNLGNSATERWSRLSSHLIPSVSLRHFSTWWIRDVWSSGVWALWPPTCTTWPRSTRGPTACQWWSSLLAANSERQVTIQPDTQHLVEITGSVGWNEFSLMMSDFCSSRRGGSWRWRPWGSWSVSSGTCMENITSGKVKSCSPPTWTVSFSCCCCCLQRFLLLSCVRLLMFLYLLYIVIFTLCCVTRPLKDAPENYTKSDMDKTIRIQKPLNVRRSKWDVTTLKFNMLHYIQRTMNNITTLHTVNTVCTYTVILQGSALYLRLMVLLFHTCTYYLYQRFKFYILIYFIQI